MLTTIALVFFLLLIVGGVITAALSEDARAGGLGTAAVALVFFLILGLISCFTKVDTKEVGIVLSFGKPTGTLSNGLHLKAPWQDVTTLDEAIQTNNHVSGGQDTDGTKFDCITTRIAHQAVTCADVSIRWRVKESQAASLYQNYRGFSAIRDSLVTRELQAATNVAFENYDVLAVDSQGLSTAPPLSSIAAKIFAQMRDEISGQGIDVQSVIVPVLHFDSATQGRINALQAQIAQTRIAQQAIQTALAQSQANQAIQQSLSNDPNVLVNKCLDLLSEAITKAYGLPAGFSCFGPSNVAITASK